MSCGGSNESNANAAEISAIAKETGLPVKAIAEVFHSLIALAKCEAGIPSGGGTHSQQQDIEAAARKNLRQAVEELSKCKACGRIAGEAHACPAGKLREYAVAEDTATAKLYDQRWDSGSKLKTYAESLHSMNGEDRVYVGGGYGYTTPLGTTLMELRQKITQAEKDSDHALKGYVRVSDAAKRLASYDTEMVNHAKLQQLIDEASDRYEQFKWNRAFLVVTSGSGHVHKSMGCSTCYPTTRFNWRPDMSGSKESEIVEAAGERACTICYPSAPVEVLSQPTKMFTSEEQNKAVDKQVKAVAKQEKEKLRIAKAATKDGSELVVEYRYGSDPEPGEHTDAHMNRERFKTERSATTWAVDVLMCTYRPPNTSEKAAVVKIIDSIAEKRGINKEEVQLEFEAKAKAKAKKYN